MKILYLTHRIPYPPNKGDKIRSFHEIKYLSRSHEIHLACLTDNLNDLHYKKELNKYCEKITIVPSNTIKAKMKSIIFMASGKPFSANYFYSGTLQTEVNNWLASEQYDAIICFSSPMAEYIICSAAYLHNMSRTLRLKHKKFSGKPRLIMDFCDVDSDKWMQYSQYSYIPINWFYKVESKLLLKYEKHINQSFDHSVFVSQQEVNMFLKLFPEAKNLTAISNGVDCEYFSPNITNTHQPQGINPKKPMLLFTGVMDYHANVDGVGWFCKEIFPEIQRKFPETQFYIVGNNPAARIRKMSMKTGINVTGFVEDTRPFYQTADVCVIPLRMARGIQNKVLEAMAMKKPIVSTRKAVVGIQAKQYQHLLLADDPKEFAEAVVTLLQDLNKSKELANNARKFAKANYNWSINMQHFEALLK